MSALDYLQHAFAQQALVAAVAVGTVCSILSVVVVLKRMAFIGQGISHAGFGGVGLALFLGLGSGLAQDAVVTLFCLAAAMIIALMSRRRRVEADTAIGVLLAASMALGILLNSLRRADWYQAWMGRTPAASFEQVLFGSILSVGRTGMIMSIIVAVIVLVIAFILSKEMLFYTFDESTSRVFGVRTTAMHLTLLAMLTVTIVTSMKLAGVILVTALLVIPGATALRLSHRLGRVMALSWAVGTFSTVAGLLLSFQFGTLPPGPLIVGVLCVFFTLAHVWAAVRERVRS